MTVAGQLIDELVVAKEGGYKLIDVPGDRGGQTYAGISRRANPRWSGWEEVDLGIMPSKYKVAIKYESDYWKPMKLDSIFEIEKQKVLLSCAVLSGVRTATLLAQGVVGETKDGIMGSKTVGAINSMSRDYFCAYFALARIARFSRICQQNPSQNKFLRGWVNRVLEEVK